MKRIFWSVLVVAALVLTAMPVCAEEAAGDMLAMAYRVSVMPGHALEFEKAYKEHTSMHKAAGDTWRWDVWQVIAGEGVGDYITRSPNHSWASLDIEVKIPNDQQHVVTTIMPHVHAISSTIIKWMPDISRLAAEMDVPKMVEVTTFTLHYSGMPEFLNVIKKLHMMIGDKELPYEYSWGMVEIGGSGVEMVLALPRSGWADFAPQSPELWEVAAEVYGQHEASTMRTNFGKAIASEENFVVAYRPDLSYVPGE
jgi:hypothetical protein